MMKKQLVQAQYREKINQAIDIKRISRPNEGWIRSLRKALGMSGAQLAVRLGVSKSRASQMERMEMEDRITLKQLRRVGEVLGCELHYALVPGKPVDEVVHDRARLKAEVLVNKVDTQMRLEAQQLSDTQLRSQVAFETQRLFNEMPRDLWED